MVRNTRKTDVLPIRVSPDTAELFRKFAEQHDFTQDKALRKLIEAGGPLVKEEC